VNSHQGTEPKGVMPLYHVMFDRKPEVECHVCRAHKAIADGLQCTDARGADGECEHVQYAICDCPGDDAGPCDICLSAGPPRLTRVPA